MRLPSRLTHWRVLLVALLAAVIAIADDTLESWSQGTAFSLSWADLLVAVAVFALALAAAAVVSAPERDEQRRLRAIQEVHHHVRNALQVVRLHEQLGADPSTRAYVDEAIERIEWVMREVLPSVGAPNSPDDATRIQPDASDPETRRERRRGE